MRISDNVLLEVVIGEGQGFRSGTAKAKLLEMAQEMGTFTKLEFLQKAVELYPDLGVVSRIAENAEKAGKDGKMAWSKAWFSELANKAKVFVPATEVSEETVEEAQV